MNSKLQSCNPKKNGNYDPDLMEITGFREINRKLTARNKVIEKSNKELEKLLKLSTDGDIWTRYGIATEKLDKKNGKFMDIRHTAGAVLKSYSSEIPSLAIKHLETVIKLAENGEDI